MKNPLTLITRFPSTKHESEIFIHKAIEEILNGDHYPLEVDIKLKNLEEIIKGIRTSTTLKNAILDEAMLYHEKTFERYGARITKSTRREWNYEGCNDSILNDFRLQLTALGTAIKERESFLQTLKPGMIAIDEATGEQLIPPSVAEKTILQISIL
ncbi:MAG: hypothetical protein WCI92_03970 [Bacteroidota bacterium]